MNGPRFQIEYGASALADLVLLPARTRKQILRKIERLEGGLLGDIKRLRGMISLTVFVRAIIASCSMSKAALF